jgi:nitrate reductase molybdenum cofactor assembly chaperone NarJ/NarW
MTGPMTGPMSERTRRLCYQAVSQLLDYPGDALTDRLPLLRGGVDALPRDLSTPLVPLVEHLETTELTAAQADYVETFDLRRRCSLYLTYYAYGDTRKRGQALLAFKHAYRSAGMVLEDGELPDHLCVVLEFAATADVEAGRQLLIDHRAGLELLGIALRDAGSPYAGAVTAVSTTLPKLRGDETEAVRKLVAQGPPGEEVGLEPFAPPDYMGARR